MNQGRKEGTMNRDNIRRIKKDLEEEKERERDGGRFEFETLNWKVNFVNDNFWDLNIKHKI